MKELLVIRHGEKNDQGQLTLDAKEDLSKLAPDPFFSRISLSFSSEAQRAQDTAFILTNSTKRPTLVDELQPPELSKTDCMIFQGKKEFPYEQYWNLEKVQKRAQDTYKWIQSLEKNPIDYGLVCSHGGLLELVLFYCVGQKSNTNILTKYFNFLDGFLINFEENSVQLYYGYLEAYKFHFNR